MHKLAKPLVTRGVSAIRAYWQLLELNLMFTNEPRKHDVGHRHTESFRNRTLLWISLHRSDGFFVQLQAPQECALLLRSFSDFQKFI